MDKDCLIAEGYELFSSFKRPSRFHTNIGNDPESRDHEQLLQGKDLHTLQLEDVACVGYNPITGLSPEGMGYFMPRLVEFALHIDHISENEREPYLWGFILQLMPGMSWKKFSLFQKKHNKFICKFLTAIENEYMDFIRTNCFEEEFLETLSAWRKKCS